MGSECGGKSKRLRWEDLADLGRSVLRPYMCAAVRSSAWAAAEILRSAQDDRAGWVAVLGRLQCWVAGA
jgi:hypothetical protein